MVAQGGCHVTSRWGPCLLMRHRLLMRQLDVVLSLVAARLSHLPWLVVVASPLVALPLPPNAMTCDGGSMCGCVCTSAEEGGG